MLDKLSPELRFLFSSIKAVILDEKTEPQYHAINELELQRKLRFHAIRLIVNDYLPYNSELTRVKGAAKAFSQNQAFLALQHQVETQRLFKLFNAAKLRVLPYKGNLFSRLIYKNQQLREYSDIDLLFHPEDAATGLAILQKDGYSSQHILGISQPKTNKEIFDANVSYELPLIKEGLHMDFHWGLHYSFLPYHIDFLSCFKDLSVKEDFDPEISIPNNELLFLLMINHHGGKEAWLRLKNIVDLLMFLKNVDFDHSRAISLLQESRLLNSTKNGLYILKHFLGYRLSDTFEELIMNYEPKNSKHTISFWEKSEHWGSILPRFHYERILIKQQDEPFKVWTYLRDIYRSYSIPNPYEIERIWTFPKSFYFLNFLSKVITYLIKKTFR